MTVTETCYHCRFRVHDIVDLFLFRKQATDPYFPVGVPIAGISNEGGESRRRPELLAPHSRTGLFPGGQFLVGHSDLEGKDHARHCGEGEKNFLHKVLSRDALLSIYIRAQIYNKVHSENEGV